MENQNKREQRRSLIKGFFAAGAAAVLGASASKKARASQMEQKGQDSQEILYRETEEFRAYYDSLLD